jgi:hypothetical protein
VIVRRTLGALKCHGKSMGLVARLLQHAQRRRTSWQSNRITSSGQEDLSSRFARLINPICVTPGASGRQRGAQLSLASVDDGRSSNAFSSPDGARSTA